MQQSDQGQIGHDVYKQSSQPSEATQVGEQQQQDSRAHASVTELAGQQQEAGAAARVDAVAEHAQRKKSTPYLNISKRPREAFFNVRLSAAKALQSSEKKDFTGRPAEAAR